MATAERRTVAYIRVSTEEQAAEGFSMEEQERQVRAYAVARGWPDPGEVYADPGVTGTTRDRPGLNRLLADARAGRVGRVICTKLDRIGRTAAIILGVEDDLDTCGVERVYIRDSIDTSTATGRLLRTVLAAVAELERDMILERTRDGYEAKARSGDIFRSRSVYGYRYIPGDKRNGQLGRLEIDETTAPVVRRIFADLAAGISMSQLAVNLNREGIPTFRRGRWAHTALSYILHNPVYWGEAAYGRTTMVKEGGKRVRRAQTDTARIHRIVDPERIPPLVTRELAETAQAAVAANRRFATRNARRDYLLRGLLRCGRCGTAMSGAPRIYSCHNTDEHGKRRPHRVSQYAIEETVKDLVAAFARDPEKVLGRMAERQSQVAAQEAALAAESRRLEVQLAKVSARQDRLLDLYMDEGIDRVAYTARAGALQTERAELLERLSQRQGERDALGSDHVPLDDVRQVCADLAARLDDFTPAEWQHALRLFVDEVIATPENVIVHGCIGSDDATTATRDNTGQADDCRQTTVMVWRQSPHGVPFTLQQPLRRDAAPRWYVGRQRDAGGRWMRTR